MNGVDVVIIIIIAALCWLGWSQRLVRQLSLSLGAIAGILFGAFLYNRLAFLADGSFGRTAVLGLLVLAAGSACYDALLTIGSRIEKKPTLPSTSQRVASSITAGVTGVVVLWLMFNVTFSALHPSLQQSIRTSVAVRASMEHLQLPAFLSNAARLLNPFSQPQAFAGTEPLFSDVAVGNNFADLDTAVSTAARSTFKVAAWGCGTTSLGTAFLVADQALVTNAHVIAGASRITVQGKDGNTSHTAEVIWFDPDTDVAVLSTAAPLPQKPLSLQTAPAKPGTLAAVLGYPGGNKFADTDAIVLQSLSAKGYDIYDKKTIVRNIYAVRSDIASGNSGSPLVDAKGTVLGLVFGHSTVQPHTAYAVTAAEIRPDITDAVSRNQVVPNGSCTT